MRENQENAYNSSAQEKMEKERLQAVGKLTRGIQRFSRMKEGQKKYLGKYINIYI